ncbi:hypothetical protein DAEQUDRAFT_756938 [Daedalea quercina L-15889]|uniref:F-box domain-containing protein n=1 Tax=Daedalea quercina L-15889 TaxID=1314783 RepID=A0A165QKL4_9APHY|nr:hypothetical protein DAEQUDRAFT_756938 [Daedalea quercina L-15889]
MRPIILRLRTMTGKRTVAHRRQTKRARQQKHARASERAANIDPKSGILPMLPLDIIFEPHPITLTPHRKILSLLTPVDLASLAQTNQAFRTTLTSSQANKTWKITRKQIVNVPDCPPGECADGRLRARDVHYAIMRRICGKCWKKKLIYSGHFAKRFPDFDLGMLELIPYTSVKRLLGVRHSTPDDRFYWEDDVYAMAKLYGVYKLDIYLSKPGAREAVNKFRDQRIKYVEAVIKHAKICQVQSIDLRRYHSREILDRINKQYDIVVQRFKELGYEHEDIQAIRHMKAVNQDRVMTESIWRDEAPLIDARKHLVRDAYDRYKRTLRPIEWVHLPPPQLIYIMPAFRSLIYTKLDVPLERAACDEAAMHLPEYILSFKDALKNRLSGLAADMASTNRNAKPTPRCNDRVFLSTSVFETDVVGNPDNLYPFEDVTAHLAWCGTQRALDIHIYINLLKKKRRDEWDWMFGCHATRTAIMKLLVTKLGLDPATTRPKDLDRLDRRFICGQCRVLQNRAYTWRGYVCSTHVVAPALRATCVTVLEHVRETHGIVEPKDSVDFFHAFPTARQRPNPQSILILGLVELEDQAEGGAPQARPVLRVSVEESPRRVQDMTCDTLGNQPLVVVTAKRQNAPDGDPAHSPGQGSDILSPQAKKETSDVFGVIFGNNRRQPLKRCGNGRVIPEVVACDKVIVSAMSFKRTFSSESFRIGSSFDVASGSPE